jgi:hypothetical protein
MFVGWGDDSPEDDAGCRQAFANRPPDRSNPSFHVILVDVALNGIGRFGYRFVTTSAWGMNAATPFLSSNSGNKSGRF